MVFFMFILLIIALVIIIIKNIQIENPEYHCQLCNRDFRLIASK